MTFQEILPQFLEGAKIRKTNWTKQYVFINNKNVIVDENNNVCHLQGHNLVEDGWEIYNDREYFDFWKALEYMEHGKGVARKAWECTDEGWIYLDLLSNNYFYIWDKDPEVCNGHHLTRADLKAKDWYVAE